MAWVLTDESCNINFLQDGSTHRTIPKEQIALEIVLAGEALNDTTVDCVFVRYEGKYAIELPYNDTTVGVTTYASAELLRAAIVALCNTNPCAGGGGGGESLDATLTIGNTTDLSAIFDNGAGVTVTISPDQIIHTDGGVTITTDPTTGGISVASGTNLGSYGSSNVNISDGTNGATLSAGDLTISDGTNSSLVSPTGFTLNSGTHTSEIKATKVSMNTAAVKTLNSLPVVAVAAPGGGYAIEIISASARNNFNTTPFDAGNRLFLEIGLSGSSQMQAASFLENTVSAITRLTYVASAMDVSNLVENQALKITSNADSVGGDGSIDVYIYYRIIQL